MSDTKYKIYMEGSTDHTHFMFELPIPNNEWDETMMFSVEISQPVIMEGKKKILFSRSFMVTYLYGFLLGMDALYSCEEIK